jgi:uncharacterized DUF497 family protein
MRFEWDPAKNKTNIRRHRIDFADVPAVFKGPMCLALDTRSEHGEDRWVGIGFLGLGIVVVVYVEREQDAIRIISARKAEKHERETFKKELSDRLGLSGQ